jgi:hypothetical protein
VEWTVWYRRRPDVVLLLVEAVLVGHRGWLHGVLLLVEGLAGADGPRHGFRLAAIEAVAVAGHRYHAICRSTMKDFFYKKSTQDTVTSHRVRGQRVQIESQFESRTILLVHGAGLDCVHTFTLPGAGPPDAVDLAPKGGSPDDDGGGERALPEQAGLARLGAGVVAVVRHGLVVGDAVLVAVVEAVGVRAARRQHQQRRGQGGNHPPAGSHHHHLRLSAAARVRLHSLGFEHTLRTNEPLLVCVCGLRKRGA